MGSIDEKPRRRKWAKKFFSYICAYQRILKIILEGKVICYLNRKSPVKCNKNVSWTAGATTLFLSMGQTLPRFTYWLSVNNDDLSPLLLRLFFGTYIHLYTWRVQYNIVQIQCTALTKAHTNAVQQVYTVRKAKQQYNKDMEICGIPFISPEYIPMIITFSSRDCYIFIGIAGKSANLFLECTAE